MATAVSVVTGVAVPNVKRGGCQLYLSNDEAIFLASLLYAAKVSSGSNWDDLTEPIRQKLLECYPGFTNTEAGGAAFIDGSSAYDRTLIGTVASQFAADSR